MVPVMTGPGGDMFALVYTAEHDELSGLNGSGYSPKAANIEFFTSRGLDQIPMRSPFWETVPDEVEGRAVLPKTHDTMSSEQALELAIEHAKNGFRCLKSSARTGHAGEPWSRTIWNPLATSSRTARLPGTPMFL